MAILENINVHFDNVYNGNSDNYKKYRSDLKTLTSYKYNIRLTYLHTDKNIGTGIKNECLKSLIIDHNYDINCMPVMYANLKLDKALVDDMIMNQNKNLFVVTMYKFDKNSDSQYETLCFRKKFIYFLPDNVNRMDPVDYNKETEEQMKGDTYTSLTLGLMCLDHINNNKHKCEITTSGSTQYDIVKYLVSHIKDMVIEPFTYNDRWNQFILPATCSSSVNHALKFLNNQRVFYSTPYRYYQDYDNTYIISSAGKAIDRPNDEYTSVVISIRDVDDVSANNTGLVINKATGTYEVYVSYANTQVYDNTLINKSKSKIRGITSSGASDISLTNTADYLDDKYSSMRLNNDNEHMIENIEAKMNSENFLLYFSKTDLDNNLFTLNKRITIRNINRYREFNGTYIMYRKREVYLREDSSFILTSMVNLKRIEFDSSITPVEIGVIGENKHRPTKVKKKKKITTTDNVTRINIANDLMLLKQQLEKERQQTQGNSYSPSNIKYDNYYKK